MARGRACIVDRCRHNGTEDLPLGDDLALDLPVCAPHARAIAAAPGGWRLTSVPVAHSLQYRVLVVRMEAA